MAVRWLSVAVILGLVAPTLTYSADAKTEGVPTSGVLEALRRDGGPSVPPGSEVGSWAHRSRGGATEQLGQDAGLLGAIASARRNLSNFALADAVRKYFHAAGRDVPSPDFGRFEQDATITFAYGVHDADLDGREDVVLNLYCVDPDVCHPHLVSPVPMIVEPPRQQPLEGTEECGLQNRLFGMSGKDGTILWERRVQVENRSLDPEWYVEDPRNRSMARLYCHLEFVVGTLPTPSGGRGVLVYGWSAWFPTQRFRLETDRGREWIPIGHRLTFIDGKTGETIWEQRQEPGYWLTVPAEVGVLWETERVVVNALIMDAPRQGVELFRPAPQVALFTQEVGFQYRAVASPPLPGEVDQCQACNHADVAEYYWPQEEITRLDLASGQELWRQRTMEGASDRSVQPDHLQGPPQPMWLPWPYATADPPAEVASSFTWYWNWWSSPCCFDQTGDGVPDLLFVTHEWHPVPYYNPQGPHDLDARLVLYDGADGSLVWERVVEEDAPRFIIPEIRCCFAFNLRGYTAAFEPLGDANGDGASDVLLIEEWKIEDYRTEIAVVDGRSGSVLWAQAFPRKVNPLVLGDANGDGGNDILLLSWHQFEYPYDARFYQLMNVTATQLAVLSGADGELVWGSETFNAPADLNAMYHNLRTGGLPDVNGDGVGDVLVDDPVFLADLTVVHNLRYLNGRNGTVMHQFLSVGNMGFPTFIGEVTGDGIDDFSIMGGDVNDLWITVYDGYLGEALWSRRLLDTRQAEFYDFSPGMKWIPLRSTRGGPDMPLLNLHIGEANVLAPSGVTPLLVVYEGRNSTLQWSIPFDHTDEATGVRGPSPATAAFERLAHQKLHPKTWVDQADEAFVKPGGLIGSLTFLAALGVTSWWGPWRWRK